jgi:hypothetical protein
MMTERGKDYLVLNKLYCVHVNVEDINVLLPGLPPVPINR